jgi:hypothetical protein
VRIEAESGHLTDNLFNVALGATSPIFNAGRINADIAKGQSHMRESELNLNQTMLNALKEIEDTRSDLGEFSERRKSPLYGARLVGACAAPFDRAVQERCVELSRRTGCARELSKG